MRRIPLFLASLALMSLLVACGGGSATETTVPTYKYKAAPPLMPPTTVVNGTIYSVPTEVPNKAIAPFTDQGTQIIITDKGLLPYHLFVASDTPVTWTNLSSKPVSITSYYSNGPSSKLIPVGGTFTWPGAGLTQFRYHTNTNYQGIVQAGVLPVN